MSVQRYRTQETKKGLYHPEYNGVDNRWRVQNQCSSNVSGKQQIKTSTKTVGCYFFVFFQGNIAMVCCGL